MRVNALSADTIGIARALEPRGALPHAARVLDAETDAGEYEAALEVHTLAVDATSFQVLSERCQADPVRMASLIAEIVAERGKLQNPWTDSGGVVMGRISAVGRSYRMPELEVGETVVPLASLVAIPMRLEHVGPVDPSSTHVPARGRAIVTGGMLCARVPGDLPRGLVLSALDVYPSASYVRALASDDTHVLVLGAGHAGLLAVAASRDAGAVVTAVDLYDGALRRVTALDERASVIRADVTDSLAVVSELARPADLTLLCTNVAGCEGTALLATAERGTILFFSTATTFAAAALGADAIGSQARLVIPNGLTDDRGDYALDLLRRLPALREAFA
jgi:L-erythro-3,5-diaminohexanoate dehydrogenase